MDRREVAHLLRTIGALLEVKGEDPFKVRSYGRAADSIESSDYDLEKLAGEGRLTDIPGVGKNLEPKVREMILTGSSSYLERLVAEIPEGVLDLLRVPGIGPKTARLLYTALGIASLDDLDAALKAHKIQGLPGMGRKREEIMAEGLAEIRRYAGRISIGVALPVAESIVASLRQKSIAAALVGEVRRAEETVSALDLLVLKNPDESPSSILERSGLVPGASSSALEQSWDDAHGRYVFGTGLGVPLRLHFAGMNAFWPRALWLTGPSEFLDYFSKKARERGLVLTEAGLVREGETLEAARTGFFGDVGTAEARFPKNAEIEDIMDARFEDLLFEMVSLSPIPPEVRHRKEFWEASAAGKVPPLVDPNDLRGDIHLHTLWSDGVAGIEAMVQAAIGMGYSYIAITDHATDMKMIRGITHERLDEYLREIRQVQEKYPGFRVYSGVEVDILRDGRLYLPDEDLARLDVVIASIHNEIDSKGDGVRRLIKAAMNPHVDVLGHPAGRLIGRRAGIVSGLEEVLEAAATTGTAIEINSSPDRLDLPENLVALGYSKGVRFAVCSDAHSPGGLGTIRYGLLTCARRAGIPPEYVVNTKPALPWVTG